MEFTCSEKSTSERAFSSSEDTKSGMEFSFLDFLSFLLCFDFLAIEEAWCWKNRSIKSILIISVFLRIGKVLECRNGVWILNKNFIGASRSFFFFFLSSLNEKSSSGIPATLLEFWETFGCLLLDSFSLLLLDFFGMGSSIGVWVEEQISAGELLNRFLLGKITIHPCPFI